MREGRGRSDRSGMGVISVGRRRRRRRRRVASTLMLVLMVELMAGMMVLRHDRTDRPCRKALEVSSRHRGPGHRGLVFPARRIGAWLTVSGTAAGAAVVDVGEPFG